MNTPSTSSAAIDVSGPADESEASLPRRPPRRRSGPSACDPNRSDSGSAAAGRCQASIRRRQARPLRAPRWCGARPCRKIAPQSLTDPSASRTQNATKPRRRARLSAMRTAAPRPAPPLRRGRRSPARSPRSRCPIAAVIRNCANGSRSAPEPLRPAAVPPTLRTRTPRAATQRSAARRLARSRTL